MHASPQSPASLFEEILQGLPASRILADYPPRAFDTPAFRARLAQAEAQAQSGPAAFEFAADGTGHLQVGEQVYALGRFSTPSLQELRALAERRSGAGQPELKLYILLGASPLSDIQYQEAYADGETVFQLASQFNGLEAPAPGIVPVSAYFGDRTQGPLGVLPAFGGALLRHYAAPGADGERFVQQAGRELNLLGDALPASESAAVSGGYLISQNVSDPQALAQALNENFTRIRIGWHQHLPIVDGPGRVDQVLTSTLAGGAYSHADTRLEPWLSVQRQLLRAAYLGTLLAAISAGRQRVVLTAIGGGVFANPHPLIWEALLWSLNQAKPLLKGQLEVILNLRSFGVAPAELRAQARIHGGELIELK